MVTQKSIFSWIFRYLRGLQALLVLLIVAATFFRVLPLEMQKRIVNLAIGMRSVDLLLLYCGLYLAAVVLAGILKYVINVIQAYIGERITTEIRRQLYEHIISLPVHFFRKAPPGLVISAVVGELSAVAEFLGSAIATPLVNLLTLAAFAGYMLYLNPLLAVVSFSVYPLELVIIPFLQKKYNKLNRRRIDITRRLSNTLDESVSGIHEIHGNGSHLLEIQRFTSIAVELFKTRFRMSRVKLFIKFTNNFFQSLGPFVLFILGGYLSIKGRLDLGALVAFLSAYEKLYDPWKELMQYYQTYQDATVRYKRVMSYFNVKSPFIIEGDGQVIVPLLKGEVEAHDVAFYVDGHPLLDGISFDAKPGSQIALVGFSGSGKSTLVMVLAQLYEYHSGQVKLDGRELKDIPKSDLSRFLGYVAQFPFIFDGTIRDNLLYACRALESHNRGDSPVVKPSDDEVYEIIRDVGLEDDIIGFGLNSRLRFPEDEHLVPEIIRLRRLFHEECHDGASVLVERFDADTYLEYCSLATNLVFGAPKDGRPAEEVLLELEDAPEVLDNLGLFIPLTLLGLHLARETLEVLRDIEEDSFFFRSTPVNPEEVEYFKSLVASNKDPDRMRMSEKLACIRLALRFTQRFHTMLKLPLPFMSYVVRCRRPFRRFIEERYPDLFEFIEEDAYITSYPIFRNIIFGTVRSEYSHAEGEVNGAVLSVIKKARMEGALLQKGLDFEVGAKGDRLSGGQKQKLAIARVLLKKPKILILDEATASLDNASQQRIHSLIERKFRGRATIFSVLHRLELVKNYDMICVMKAGKIIEQGSYDELMQKKGVLYELVSGF
ncbi:ABC transporter ATP-binding protein/permease [Thermodesulforhabdus norvegica]|uniref:Putative ABC transport system ATP-binding protein n=1 Tax=Thermodesulforhabdus norvegica TaxID=39841 RepID=A0A1I4VZG0_9BACT|nr:ABC transporter transmembrane domain-containing protein [Thermodesulforhabdus norvegica]SFN06397.1 putative ABC transport system ATP-binding protein [Thermodesulforhabdus norvegica]